MDTGNDQIAFIIFGNQDAAADAWRLCVQHAPADFEFGEVKNHLQRIAEMLYPDPPNVDPFWTASARSLFLGIALYLFETPSMPKTLNILPI